MSSRPWYAFYPKDYEQKTAHLTIIQDGAYRRLLDRYYMSGVPLPANAELLYRICRAFDDAERAAIDFVLGEFFVLTPLGYTQERVEDELKKATNLSETRRKAANSRHTKGDANACANAEQEHTQSQSQSQSHIEISSLRSDISAVPPTDRKSSNRTLKAKPRKAEPDGFPDWYSAFPRHVARPSAAKAYAAALGRGASPIELLAGARRYAQERIGENPQFTKHPATWLNNDGWLDEPKPNATLSRDHRPPVKILSILEEEPCP